MGAFGGSENLGADKEKKKKITGVTVLSFKDMRPSMDKNKSMWPPTLMFAFDYKLKSASEYQFFSYFPLAPQNFMNLDFPSNVEHQELQIDLTFCRFG